MRGAEGNARDTLLCLRGVVVGAGKGALKEKVEVEGSDMAVSTTRWITLVSNLYHSKARTGNPRGTIYSTSTAQTSAQDSQTATVLIQFTIQISISILYLPSTLHS